MFEEFMSGTLAIRLTKYDTERLSELQEALGGIRWASRHEIDSELTRHYINRENIYIYTACKGIKNERAIFLYADIKHIPEGLVVPTNIVTLDEFLEGNSEFDVLEDDLMKLL